MEVETYGVLTIACAGRHPFDLQNLNKIKDLSRWLRTGGYRSARRIARAPHHQETAWLAQCREVPSDPADVRLHKEERFAGAIRAAGPNGLPI